MKLRNNDIISGSQLLQKNFKKLGLTGEWLELMGDVEAGKPIFIWGSSGGGKSTFVLSLFRFLTENYGKGLYIAGEEGLGETLKKRVQKEFADNPKRVSVCSKFTTYDTLIELEKAKKPQHRFRVIVIDSYQLYNNMNYTEYAELAKALPWATIIGINQMKVDGDPYGGNKIRHDADVKIQIVEGMAYIQSRYLPAPITKRLFTPERKKNQQQSLF